MSLFDTQDLLNAEVGGEMATQYTPIPAGEYEATIVKVAARVIGQDKDRAVLDVTWGVSDPAVIEATGLDRPTVRQTVFLDVEGGRLAVGKGKNVQLGKLREAVGQNRPTGWNPQMLQGMAARIAVEHRSDPNDAEKMYAEVRKVTAL